MLIPWILALQGLNKDGQLPGFAVAVFNKDSIFLQKAYGYADLEEKKTFSNKYSAKHCFCQ